MRRPLFVLLTALFIACSPSSTTPDDPTSAVPSSLQRGKVSVQESGLVSKILACSGICIFQWGFWVDLAVENEAPDKQVGIRYTRSGWASYEERLATYERTLEDGREVWGIDVDLGQGPSDRPEIEYAAFVKMNGVTSWDPLNNHFIRDYVNESRPVRLLRSGVRYDVGTGAVLFGDVRVLDVAFEKQVSVRFTVDQWAHEREADAAWRSGQEWHFEIPLGSSLPLPEEVELAVHYRAGDVDAWDNRGGENYRHALRPVFVPSAPPASPLSGIVTLGGAFRTDLPRLGQSTRVDGQPWTSGEVATFSTLSLQNGAHEVSFRFESNGGFSEVATIPFTVENRIQPLSTWSPPQLAAPNEYPWDGTVGTDGQAYVLWSDGTVVRSPSVGSSAAPFTFPAVASAHRIAVDAQRRLYVLVANGAATLQRFLPTGALDASFANAGTLSLSTPVEGTPWCFSGYVTATDARVIVSDTCNERLIVYDESGAFTQVLKVPADYSAVTHQAFFDGARLWVPTWSRVVKFLWDGSSFHADGSVELPANLQITGAEGIVVRNGRIWIVDGTPRMLALDASTGALQASWTFGYQKLGLLGEAALPRALALQPDGTLVVTAATSKTMERFSSTLR